METDEFEYLAQAFKDLRQATILMFAELHETLIAFDPKKPIDRDAVVQGLRARAEHLLSKGASAAVADLPNAIAACLAQQELLAMTTPQGRA